MVRILGWIGIVWGGLIVLGGGVQLFTGLAGGGAYQFGEATGIALGALMLYAGLRAVRSSGRGRRPGPPEPPEP